MKNYAGHRLSPWLGHLMVSRSETARQLLTPGEVMQLPPDDEIVMVAGIPPIRAKKVRYYNDRRFTERVLPPPDVKVGAGKPRRDDWSGLLPIAAPQEPEPPQQDQPREAASEDEDAANAGLRRQPDMERHIDVAPPPKPAPVNEFELDEPEADTDAALQAAVRRQMQGLARQASLDPGDGVEL